MKKILSLVLAVALHNIPEGMALGVVIAVAQYLLSRPKKNKEVAK